MDLIYDFEWNNFLKELEVAINPFIQDKIIIEEYM